MNNKKISVRNSAKSAYVNKKEKYVKLFIKESMK